MEGTGFKSIFVFLLLALLAFVAGSLASDSARDALVPSVIVLGLFLLIFLGKNCWWLIMVLPPVLLLLDFPILQKFPLPGALAAVILFYWFIMSVLGYAKFTWNGVKWLDISVLVFVSYFLYTWVRHPVTVLSLVSSTDFSDVQIGGVDYFFCIGAIFYYIALSVIPLKIESILKSLKVGFWLSVVASIFMCVKGLTLGNNVQAELADTVVSARYVSFAPLGMKICYYLFSKYTILGIILSPWKILVLIVGLFGVAVSGYRYYFMELFVFVAVSSYVLKSLLSTLLLGILLWGALIYLSYENILEKLPYGVQRVATAVPCVLQNEKALTDAKGSVDWRIELWEWALDPSKGYIKDYMFGDGFSLSLNDLKQKRVAIHLGLSAHAAKTSFAEQGMWHSGYITSIHRIGYVGLWLMIGMMLVLITITFRVVLALRVYSGREYAYISMIAIFSCIVGFFAAAGIFKDIFYELVPAAAVVKVMYSIMKREGKNPFLIKKRLYTPLMLGAESES